VARNRTRPTQGSWRELALRALEDAGHRTGGARVAVVDLLSRQDCCLSAQEIAERLSASGNAVGTASVYRALDTLHRLGMVQRIDTGEGRARYEPVQPGGEHHHHVVCDACGEIVPFEDTSLERAIDRLGARLAHQVSGHDVVIHGHCARCSEG
jgi:Fur family ferric uptake transcriptional regulator